LVNCRKFDEKSVQKEGVGVEKIFDSLTELRKQLEEYLEDKLIDDNDPTLNQILATIDSLCVELFQKEMERSKSDSAFP